MGTRVTNSSRRNPTPPFACRNILRDDSTRKQDRTVSDVNGTDHLDPGPDEDTVSDGGYASIVRAKDDVGEDLAVGSHDRLAIDDDRSVVGQSDACPEAVDRDREAQSDRPCLEEPPKERPEDPAARVAPPFGETELDKPPILWILGQVADHARVDPSEVSGDELLARSERVDLSYHDGTLDLRVSAREELVMLGRHGRTSETMNQRVAVLTQHGTWSASTRSRALQYLEGLSAVVGTVDVFLADDEPERLPGRVGQCRYFASHAQRYVRRHRELDRLLPSYDAVLVQRGLYAMGPGFIVGPLERFQGRVVLDLDDDVFSPTPSMRGKGPAARWLYGPHQARRLVERADAIVVSTPNLASALPACQASVTVLPTVPEVASYAQAIDGGTPGLVGWAGTSGGLAYLDPLEQLFAQLSDEGVGRLRVVSSAPWPGKSEFVRWHLDEEATMFAQWAVGIMPLPDTAYARSKAGYKLLQYMAAGVPSIASPVGANIELLEESGGGILAKTVEDWDRAIRRLLGDAPLRTAMGQRGRAFVEEMAQPAHHIETLRALLVD